VSIALARASVGLRKRSSMSKYPAVRASGLDHDITIPRRSTDE